MGRRRGTPFWLLAAMSSALLEGGAHGETFTITYQPGAAVVCAGVSILSGECSGQLIVNSDGSASYNGRALVGLIEGLNGNPDSFTILKVGFSIEELSALASDASPAARPHLTSTAQSILRSALAQCLPTLTSIMKDSGKPLDLRAASADALTRIVKTFAVSKEQKQELKIELKLFEPEWERFDSLEKKREAQEQIDKQQHQETEREYYRSQYPSVVAKFHGANEWERHHAIDDLMSKDYKECLDRDEATRRELAAFFLAELKREVASGFRTYDISWKLRDLGSAATDAIPTLELIAHDKRQDYYLDRDEAKDALKEIKKALRSKSHR